MHSSPFKAPYFSSGESPFQQSPAGGPIVELSIRELKQRLFEADARAQAPLPLKQKDKAPKPLDPVSAALDSLECDLQFDVPLPETTSFVDIVSVLVFSSVFSYVFSC